MAEQGRCEHVAPLHRQLIVEPGAERLAARGDRFGRRSRRRVAAARAGRTATAGPIAVVVLAVFISAAHADRFLAIIFGVEDHLASWRQLEKPADERIDLVRKHTQAMFGSGFFLAPGIIFMVTA